MGSSRAGEGGTTKVRGRRQTHGDFQVREGAKPSCTIPTPRGKALRYLLDLKEGERGRHGLSFWANGTFRNWRQVQRGSLHVAWVSPQLEKGARETPEKGLECAVPRPVPDG